MGLNPRTIDSRSSILKGLRLSAVLSVLLGLLAVVSSAQQRLSEAEMERLYGPPLPDRPTVQALFKTNSEGLLEWRESKKRACLLIGADEDSHPIYCRYCGGSKQRIDLKDLAPCFGCSVGEIYCHLCYGQGKVLVWNEQRSSASPATCLGCSGKGHFRCTICKGKRLVPISRINGKRLEDASEEEIKSRYEALVDANIEILRAMKVSGVEGLASARKYRSLLPYAQGQASLIVQLQRNEARLRVYKQGEGFSAEVAQRLSTTFDRQASWEIAILKAAMKHFELTREVEAKKAKTAEDS